jgi:hypothetical protein
LRYQIATKLHAVTERFEDRENDRVRDLIDRLLLAELESDLARVRDACVDIFESREKHAWPPALDAEPSWPEQYRALAREQGSPGRISPITTRPSGIAPATSLRACSRARCAQTRS